MKYSSILIVQAVKNASMGFQFPFLPPLENTMPHSVTFFMGSQLNVHSMRTMIKLKNAEMRMIYQHTSL